MRSRYCAFVICDSKYIIKTTHPLNEDYKNDTDSWKNEILYFSTNYTFQKLSILDFIDGEDTAYVTFTAKILFDEHDESFTEKSMFKKVKKQWLYLSGIHLS